MTKDKFEKVKINRLEAISNTLFFHGHFFGYVAIIFIIIGIVFLNIYPILFGLVLLFSQYIYIIDILIGKAYKVNGNIISKKTSIIYSILGFRENDNYCYKLIIDDGKKCKKALLYDKTKDVTFSKKAKIKKYNVTYEITYYVMPLSHVVVDIDYKCKYVK